MHDGKDDNIRTLQQEVRILRYKLIELEHLYWQYHNKLLTVHADFLQAQTRLEDFGEHRSN